VKFFNRRLEKSMDVRLKGVSCGGRRQRRKGGPVCRSAVLKQRQEEKQA